MQRYQVVSQNEIEKLHETSLRIMDEIGIVIPYEPALEVLKRGGAKIDGQRVHYPKEMVERELKNVPSSFTLYSRNPERNVELSPQKTAYAGPNCPPFVHDLDKGRRDGTLEDFRNLARLCHMLPNIDLQSNVYCEPQDVNENIRHLEMVYNAFRCNEKPLMGGTMGYEASKECIELAAIPFGGVSAIKDKPVMSSIPCTLTPLSYDPLMAGAIMAYAEYGQAQLVNSLVIAGATTPVTLPAAIVLQNAEVLAGIVLAQLVNPGTPIVYSAAGTNSDMRTGSLALGSPENALFSLVNGQLAKFYNIPCRISGALTDSKCVDAQAGYESMMTLLMGQMAGGNFILHGGGILETYNCVSYEKLVMDDELIGMVKRIGRGMEFTDETMTFDLIKEVGPQGAYIDHKHTFKNFRKEFYLPVLSDRSAPNKWKDEGALTAEQRANIRWKKMLAEYQEPDVSADVIKDMEKYINDRR